MKTLLLILISVAAMGQVKLREPQPSEVEIQYNHEKNSFKKKIFGKIEVDGHIVSDSIKFYLNADLFESSITDTKGNKYTARKCSKKECKIIHLEMLRSGSLYYSPPYDLQITPGIFKYEN